MSNNTKVLRYDLERNLQTVFDQLDELKQHVGTVDLYKIFTNINTSMLAEGEKKVVEDLISGFNKSSLNAVERIEKLEDVKPFSADSLIEGDYSESFEYDSKGEIIRHKADGDMNFQTFYSYGGLVPLGETTPIEGSNVLVQSVNKFKSTIGEEVEVTKKYFYDGEENIVKIETSTKINGV